MKVLGFLKDSAWDKLDAVQFYRTFLPLRELSRHCPDGDIKCVGDEVVGTMSDDDLGGRDIYTMSRMYNLDMCQEFVDEVHRRGGLIVLDTDDDLTEKYRLVSGRGDEFLEVLGMMDYVSVSTPPLVTLLGPYCKREPVVLRNCVDSSWMQNVAAKSRRIVEDSSTSIGLSGSPTHWRDWQLPSVPLARIGKEYPDVSVLLHGDVPRYLQHISKNSTVLNLGPVPFSIYPVLLRQFDILLCAVDSDDRFNDGKSGLKALECMALGVVPICSQFGPYLDLAAAGAPIVIIKEESRDGWYEAMRNLLEHDDRRRHLSALGPAWVLKHRDMVNGGYKQWLDFYREIAN